jgi:hypothetical protein
MKATTIQRTATPRTTAKTIPTMVPVEVFAAPVALVLPGVGEEDADEVEEVELTVDCVGTTEMV